MHTTTYRDSLYAVLQSLEGHLGAIAMTTELLCDHQDQQMKLDEQADILREALQSPNHPLITMQDRWAVRSLHENIRIMHCTDYQTKPS